MASAQKRVTKVIELMKIVKGKRGNQFYGLRLSRATTEIHNATIDTTTARTIKTS